VHTDNLAGAGVVTDSTGVISEAEDYYPYGGIRIDTKTNYGGEKRKYAGTEYDALSGLNYAMARYQSPTRGQFISEDPVYLAIGNPETLKALTQREQRQFLMDPQQMNSYAYARGNPIVMSDPQGLASKFGSSLFSPSFPIATLEYFGFVSTLATANAYFSDAPKSPTTQNNLAAQLQFDVSTGVVALFASTPQAAALAIGGVVLQGVDAYCAGNTCKDFSGAANSTPAAILSSMRPSPGTVPSPYNLNASTANSGAQAQRGNQGGGSGVINSPAGAQFVSSLQSFVAALSAYVSSLSQSSGSRGNNSGNK
jgi:RHS repeat-associated protein